MEYGYSAAQRGVRRGVIVAQKTQNGIDRYALSGIIGYSETQFYVSYKACGFYIRMWRKKRREINTPFFIRKWHYIDMYEKLCYNKQDILIRS